MYVAPTPLPTVSVATLASTKPLEWSDEQTVVSRDGTFSLRYPAMTFKATAPGNTIVLTSEISEKPWGYGSSEDVVYHVVLTKLTDPNLVGVVRTFIDPDSFKRAFPTQGGANVFKPIDGFLDEHRGENGAHGYVVQMGVEGTGEHLFALTTKDGDAWKFECNYCCGLIEKPKMTAEKQLALCDEILAGFERDR